MSGIDASSRLARETSSMQLLVGFAVVVALVAIFVIVGKALEWLRNRRT